MGASPSASSSAARTASALVLFLLHFLSGCGDGSKPTVPQDSSPPARVFSDSDYVAAFHRGVSELEQHRFVEAATTFDELARSRPNLVAPWINLASSQLNRNVEASHALCLAAADKATALDPKAPQPYFLRGILYKHLGRFDDAEKQFRETLKYAPDDPATLYNLSSVISEKNLDEATQLLEKAIEGETHFSGAYYALMGLKRRSGAGGAEELTRIFQAFEAANTGNKMKIVYTEMGRLGDAIRDLPVVAESRPESQPSPNFEFAAPLKIHGKALAMVDLGGNPAIVLFDEKEGLSAWVRNGKMLEPAPKETFPDIRGAPPNVAAGDFDGDGIEDLALAEGSIVLLKGDGKAFKTFGQRLVHTAPATKPWHCLWSDLDQDGDLDLVAWNADEIALLINRRDGTFEYFNQQPSETKRTFQPKPLPPVSGTISHVCATDLDGDGDPDILMAGDFGLRLWRNDRLLRFTDVTAKAGLSAKAPIRMFQIGDFDGNRTLDILTRSELLTQSVAGPYRLTFSPKRIEVPERVSDLFNELASRPGESPEPICVGDFDCEGNDELVMGSLAYGAFSGSTKIWIHRISDLLADRHEGKVIQIPDLFALANPVSSTLVTDINEDCVPDVIVSDHEYKSRSSRTYVYLGRKPPQNHALEIKLKGKIFANTMHSNMGGIGARVEVMAGNRFQVREMRSDTGNTLHFGLGTRTAADYVRIVWPDDVLQSEGWVPADQIKVIEEFQRKASSCPILFAWNGERFECVTDFLGTGGLGFFLEPGVYGPPDPTELVLIPRLEPKDGKLEIRIHEPFEEITYLDSAKLIAIDHPADVDVVPDERFSINAPQPDGKLLAIGKRIDPVAARDGRGKDVLQQVLASDRKQAHAVADPRFLGYAEPTTFEFDFAGGLAAKSGSDAIYLALDGWVEYPYSHINLAAFQAGVRLEAMSVEVEVAGKGFVRIQNEAAYPAGMPRIMTLPLGKLPDGLTGKLRLLTNQELWIDRLYLFQPADAKLETRVLQASSAVLRASGYPREYSPDGGAPRLYDYDIRDPSFPWKTMGGAYTRFGEVGELLRDADDCYAVFGGGEEIAMTFDAPPPPAPGMKRTYVLDTFGWCKDMDAYTAFPDTVEPLPFKGMSNYPYRADEAFPEGEAQKKWRREYQTRVVPGTRAR